MSNRIAIVCFDGFTDIDVFLPWDVLNRVRVPGWQVRLVGARDAHTSLAGLTVPMMGPLEETADADAVIVGSGHGGIVPLLDDAAWLSRLMLEPRRQLVGSMCTGSAILAKKGLLDGLTATTYPSSVPLLRSLGVELVEEPMVVHGNIATAAGCLAAQRLSRWIIEGLAGVEAADAALASILPVGEGCVPLPKGPAKTLDREGLTGAA